MKTTSSDLFQKWCKVWHYVSETIYAIGVIWFAIGFLAFVFVIVYNVYLFVRSFV